MTSELSGFYRLGLKERRTRLAKLSGLTEEQVSILSGELGLCDLAADRMVENAVGVLGLPLGVCVNLRVNGEDVVVPMAVEEPSVVAAASNAAKWLRSGDGITTQVSPAHMIGQIQILEVQNQKEAEQRILNAAPELIELANQGHPHLIKAGGGAVGVEVRHLEPMESDDPLGSMLIVHLVADVRDAMGANAVNTMCERLAEPLKELSGGRVGLRILSNLNDRRTVRARGMIPFAALGKKNEVRGKQLAYRIEEASVFAERDPYRAATHNKGIMNGVDAVLVAFGQDWRAVEAGAHAYTCRNGRYQAMARWRVEEEGLVGTLEIPMAVGTVGGVAKVHPTVEVTRTVAGVKHASQLASVAAAVGLAQNVAALRALAAEGIQSGHMRLHARNVAVEAGAIGDEVAKVSATIAEQHKVNLDAAQKALANLRNEAKEQTQDEPDIMLQFEGLHKAFMPEILKLIREVVEQAHPDGSTLEQMLQYHMQTGGKRLRALTPLMVAKAFGRDPEELLALGAACEMLHNATLVHDDLQDGDTTRRGQATVWAHFGMPQAVNLGDAMFYYTVLLSQRLGVPAPRREVAARRLLLETLRVIDGQELEFALKHERPTTIEDYFRMVEGKTSGLFALPIAGAAEVLGQPKAVVEALAEAARHLGVLFQIQDDVLDIYGDKGRGSAGSDIGEGKRSVLVVHALTHADNVERAWLLDVLDKPREETTDQNVQKVIELFHRTGSLTFALDEIRSRRTQALEAPALQNHPRVLKLLQGLADLFARPIASLLEGPPIAPAISRDAKEDLAFCHDILPGVSRTFALSIEALPSSLKDAVAISYLLCRIVDTIEDEANIEPSIRAALFGAFDRAMENDAVDFEPDGVELGNSEAEKRLMAEANRVFRAFRRLDDHQKDAIRPHVLEMSFGMREYTSRADAAGELVLTDMQDLERYCYYVAGTVGKLLTALFEHTVPVLEEEVRTAIRERAVAFGLGLQMVNIVKDVAVDLERGDVFLPQATARAHGVQLKDLLAPQKRQPSLAVVRAVCARARLHLEKAAEYTTLWPTPQGTPVRQFCAVPLALALASLVEVESGSDTLRPGRVPKISREQVAHLFAEITEAVDDNDGLLALFSRCLVNQESNPDVEVHVPSRPPSPPLSKQRQPAGESESTSPPPTREAEQGTVLVVGAETHLGANLVRRLLSEQTKVRVVLPDHVDHSMLQGLDIEVRTISPRDRAALKAAFEGIEIVHHLSPGLNDTLDLAKSAGVNRIVAALSDSEVLSQGTRRSVVAIRHPRLVGPADFGPSEIGQLMLDAAAGQLKAFATGASELSSTRDAVQAHLTAAIQGQEGQTYRLEGKTVTLETLLDYFEEVSGRPRPRMRIPLSTLVRKIPNRFTPRMARLWAPDEERNPVASPLVIRSIHPIQEAIHEAYNDFIQRGLLPRAPSMRVTEVSDEAAGDTGPSAPKGKTAAA